MALEEISKVQALPADRSKISKLWRIALILGVVTLIEFMFAFTLPRGVSAHYHICLAYPCESFLYCIGIHAPQV